MGSTTELTTLIRHFLTGLLARRWTILTVAWIVCLIGWFVVATLPNRYTASTRVYVDTQTLLRPLMKDMTVQPDVERQVDMMRRTLLTRPNVEQIVRRTDLDLDTSSPLEMERLIEQIASKINIALEGPNLFRIEFSNQSPRVAQRVVDTTLQIFVDMSLGDQQRDMENARRFIDQQIDEYQTKLRNAELAVAEFKRANGDQLGNTDRLLRDRERAAQELTNMQSSLQSAIWQRDQLRVQVSSQPQYLEQTASAGGAQRGQLQAQLAEQQSQLARLQTQFTARHPDIQALRNLIALTEAQLKSAPTGSVSRQRLENPTWTQLNAELQRAELSISGLELRIARQQELIEDLSRRMADTPEAEAELMHLTRDHEVMLRQYQQLIERRESARMAQRMGAEADSVEFRIIEPPLEPIEPSGPPRVLLMAGVLIVGLGLGGALALIRLLMLDAFSNSKQLADVIGLPVIGTLSVANAPAQDVRRILEATTATVVAAFLLVSFGGLSYFYLANPTPPELMGMVENVTNSMLQRLGRSI